MTTSKRLKDISLQELLKHNSDHEDCWTSIYGKIYRVTDWKNKHPGGDVLIRLATGRDATILFQSYHPSHKLKIVEKYLEKLEIIGNLKYKSLEDYEKTKTIAKGKEIVNAEALHRVGCDPTDPFWVRVNEKVYNVLNNEKIDWKWHPWLFTIEVIITFILWISCIYINLYSSIQDWKILACTIVLHGFVTGRIGLIQHTGNHGGSTYHNTFNKVQGIWASFTGMDHESWIYWHQGSHHVAPNQLDIDANLTNNYAVNRLHRDLGWKPWHAYQILIYNLLIFFGWLKWFTLDIYHAFKDERKMLEFKPKKNPYFWPCKITWIMVYLILPRFITGGWGYLLSFVLLHVIASYYLAMGFLVNHYHEDLYDPKYTKPGLHWSVLNVVGSANWSSGSVWQNWFWGGLNHQIEHHLFPSMNHMVYPYIASVVKETCVEFNYPYSNYSGFFAIWKSFYNYLRVMGIRPEWEHN